MPVRLCLHLALLVLACLAFGSCKKQPGQVSSQPGSGSAPSSSGHRVVFLSSQSSRVYESTQRQTLSRLMSVSPRFVLQIHDAGQDAALQRSQFKKAVDEKPFVIVLDPLDPRGLSPEIQSAVADGILIIGLGDNALGSGCSTVIHADQHQLGRQAGEMVVAALRRKSQEEGKAEPMGRVIEIRGDDLSPRCETRHDGFVTGLRTASGVILVHDAPGDWSLTGGRDRTLDALRLQQTFDVVYAHDDIMALGASTALVQTGKRDNVMIIGTDGFRGKEGGLTLVGDGEIDATLYHPILVDLAWQIIRESADKPSFRPKPVYEMPLRIIQPRDLDEIRLRGLPPLPSLE